MTMTMKTMAGAVLGAALLLAVPALTAPSAAWAHGRQVGPNGGMQTHAGPLHAELLVKGQEVTVFMYTMQDEPIPMDGGSGTATVLAAGKPERVELKPAGGNKLVGKGAFAATDDLKVVISVTPPGKSAVTARYDLSGKAGN